MLGDRRFNAPWGGSVVDSIIGTYLTQNVSDVLSSQAFMQLASRFPVRPCGDQVSLGRTAAVFPWPEAQRPHVPFCPDALAPSLSSGHG